MSPAAFKDKAEDCDILRIIIYKEFPVNIVPDSDLPQKPTVSAGITPITLKWGFRCKVCKKVYTEIENAADCIAQHQQLQRSKFEDLTVYSDGDRYFLTLSINTNRKGRVVCRLLRSLPSYRNLLYLPVTADAAAVEGLQKFGKANPEKVTPELALEYPYSFTYRHAAFSIHEKGTMYSITSETSDHVWYLIPVSSMYSLYYVDLEVFKQFAKQEVLKHRYEVGNKFRVRNPKLKKHFVQATIIELLPPDIWGNLSYQIVSYDSSFSDYPGNRMEWTVPERSLRPISLRRY